GVDKAGCRYMFGGCSVNDDCCPRLGCHSLFSYCAWDLTFSD
uniref:Omega-theraphotoxin-Hg1a n=1 Tax=Hysterocrates gigas TaxID=118972 RepID=TX482_HYSGI|nr:RecName: Full=Omega-theraphotoxin-Hg1a; Short=Omega-TRTX-Hg1a; AltName: Full=Toxin SNX-482; Short=SNX482 [Hysterocrates gigas]